MLKIKVKKTYKQIQADIVDLYPVALVKVDVRADTCQPPSVGGEVGPAVGKRATHSPRTNPLRSQHLRKGGQPHIAGAQLLPQEAW